MYQINLSSKYKMWGWIFVFPATAFIFILCFYPMIQAFILSLQSGLGSNLYFSGLRNYMRLFQDEIFLASLINVLVFLVLQVPIMLFLALVLAVILNDEKLKFKGMFRTMIFLPCTVALVSASIIFRSFFATEGLINSILLKIGFLSSPIPWLTHPFWAKIVIVLVTIWRWTGYTSIFYLAGLQNIDNSIYEAARIDGVSALQQFSRITIPLLKPIIVLTAIMSTNGTLQLFAEPKTLTNGGPGASTLTLSLHIYNLSFVYNPQFGYAAAVSYAILILVACLSLIQIRVGDKS
ncbi:MAG: sugar ABC transporter permease [Treponema sp.]|nr:sugar ABC transporter permease [Treponema sp.]